MHLISRCPLLLHLLLAIAPSVAMAQTETPPNAGTTGTPAPSSSLYLSAFSDYKPYKEPVLMSWRQANDQVRDKGGMQGHDMATMKSPTEAPHTGYEISKMPPARPDAAAADHAGHGKRPVNESKIKKEKE